MFIKMFNIAFPTRYKVKLVDWDSSDRNSRNQGSSHVGAPARIKLGVLQGSWQFQSFLFDILNVVQSCRHEIAETKCWSKVTQLMNVDQADWKSWDPRWWADQRQREDLWVFTYQLKINFKRFSGGQMLWMPSPPTADVDIMPAAAKLAIWWKPKRQVFIQNCFRPQKSFHGFHHHLSGSF